MQDMLLKVAIFTPITTGLVAAVKASNLIDTRFLPLVAIVIGGIFGFLFVSASLLGVLAGLALGLASVGLFEFGRTTVAGQ